MATASDVVFKYTKKLINISVPKLQKYFHFIKEITIFFEYLILFQFQGQILYLMYVCMFIIIYNFLNDTRVI